MNNSVEHLCSSLQVRLKFWPGLQLFGPLPMGGVGGPDSVVESFINWPLSFTKALLPNVIKYLFLGTRSSGSELYPCTTFIHDGQLATMRSAFRGEVITYNLNDTCRFCMYLLVPFTRRPSHLLPPTLRRTLLPYLLLRWPSGTQYLSRYIPLSLSIVRDLSWTISTVSIIL